MFATSYLVHVSACDVSCKMTVFDLSNVSPMTPSEIGASVVGKIVKHGYIKTTKTNS